VINAGLYIYQEGELDEKATTEDYSVVRQQGERQVSRKLEYYNLDAVIREIMMKQKSVAIYEV
jgi:hypothetical protein